MQADTFIYIRVSSEDQNPARQEKELKKWATSTGSKKTITVIEKISGSVPASDRRLNEAFDLEGIKRVVVKDIDRLGRDELDILQTIKAFTSKNINLTVTGLGLDSLLPNGKENPAFNIVRSVMATLAEMERKKIKERQREGIAIAKVKGTYKGRKRGTTYSDTQILNRYKPVVKQLKQNQSLRNTAKICGVSVNTVQKVKRAMASTTKA